MIWMFIFIYRNLTFNYVLVFLRILSQNIRPINLMEAYCRKIEEGKLWFMKQVFIKTQIYVDFKSTSSVVLQVDKIYTYVNMIEESNNK